MFVPHRPLWYPGATALSKDATRCTRGSNFAASFRRPRKTTTFPLVALLFQAPRSLANRPVRTVLPVSLQILRRMGCRLARPRRIRGSPASESAPYPARPLVRAMTI